MACAACKKSRTEEWTSHNWMDSRLGPKIDQSCITLITSGGISTNRVLSIGGWNNQVLNQTEIFDMHSKKWSPKQNSTLNHGIRSAVLLQLESLYLIGGVRCNETAYCSKLDTVYQYEKKGSRWALTNDNLNIPRSSHVAIQAPISYFPNCSAPP